jgi:hypothetical protein
MHVINKKFTNTMTKLAIQIVFVLEFLQYFDYDGVDNLAMGLRDD